ncbi:MAG: zinc ribbon domain-containing protein [Acidimicrobiia bacterium]
MTAQHACESCGMPIDDGTYCEYCSDDNGNLQPFEERFERMVQWTMGRDDSNNRDRAEADTLAYMATMPAWRDHPRVKAATGNG